MRTHVDANGSDHVGSTRSDSGEPRWSCLLGQPQWFPSPAFLSGYFMHLLRYETPLFPRRTSLYASGRAASQALHLHKIPRSKPPLSLSMNYELLGLVLAENSNIKTAPWFDYRLSTNDCRLTKRLLPERQQRGFSSLLWNYTVCVFDLTTDWRLTTID